MPVNPVVVPHPSAGAGAGRQLRYSFGPFTLDVSDRRLLRDGTAVALTPKVFDTLVVLLRHRGRLVTKEDLMREVWPDSYVEESNLTQNVSVLRRVLGEGDKQRTYIETVPRAGYRFVAPVEEAFEEPARGPDAGRISLASAAPARQEPAEAGDAVSHRARRRWWVRGAAVVGGAATLAGTALLFLAGRDRPSVAADYRIRPFATALPAQMYPAWSPDGQSIAYLGERGGVRQIMVQGVNASAPTAVTGPDVNPVPRQFPFWSPDSRFVYFIANAAGARTSDLMRVPAIGGRATVVQRAARAATISPDGRTLVTLGPGEDGRRRLWTTSPVDGVRRPYEPMPFEAERIYQRPTLAFSPDGRQILVSATLPGQPPQYWLLPWPAGSFRRGLESLPFGSVPNFAWMPDSRHVAFFVERDRRLYFADTVTGRHWAAASVDRWPLYPSLSPDGSRLAYQSALSHTDVVAVPLAGGPVQPLLDSSASEEMPTASRVTDEIAYVTDHRGRREIFVGGAGRPGRPLFATPAPGMAAAPGAAQPAPAPGARVPVDLRLAPPTAGAPEFSPDGRWLAYRVGLNAATSGIVATSIAGDQPVRIVAQAGGLFSPTWSPNGDWLAFLELKTGGYFLVKARVDGDGTTIEIAPSGMGGLSEAIMLPEWSPSGEWIACANREGRLMLLSPDGRTSKVLGAPGPVAWAPDGKTLYQIRYEDRSLVAIEVNTNKVRVLRSVGDLLPYATSEPARRVSLSRDGKSLVYAVLRPREEIWLLEGLRMTKPWLSRFWPQ